MKNEIRKGGKARKQNDFWSEVSRMSVDLEHRLIAHIYRNPEKVFEVAALCPPSSFYGLRERRLYELVIKSEIEGQDLYSAMRQRELENKEVSEASDVPISEVLQWVTDYYISYSVERVGDMARRINAIHKTIQVAGLLEETYLNIEVDTIDEEAKKFHTKFIDLITGKEARVSEIKEIIKGFEDVQEEYSEKIINGNTLIGFSTGFKELDELMDGFRKGHLWTIGGYTSMGKTFFSLNSVVAAIDQKKRVVYYSLEMSANDILARILGIMCNINGIKIFKGQLTESERNLVNEAKKALEESGISIHCDMRDLEEIRMSMIEENIRNPVDIFMLDYIQQVSVAGQNDHYNEMRLASKAFQSMAQNLNTTIYLLSQISNEAARSNNSQVIGLKGAGEIAAASDIVGEIILNEDNKDDYETKLREGRPIAVKLVVKKNRHGEIKSLPFDFEKKVGRFHYGFKE